MSDAITTTAPSPYVDRIAAALAWLDAHAAERPVEAAIAHAITGTGDAGAVTAALGRYRNPDGGMGNGLEPDISAPVSNPFAARLALLAAIDARVPADDPLVAGVVAWLEEHQDEDGCWRWLPGTLDAPIAPWFAGWTFPALNPALDLAGCLRRLGLGSDRLHARCRALYGDIARPDELTDGDFYVLLPYAESLPWLPDLPDRDAHLDLLVANIARGIDTGTYPTPGHAAEHIGPADGPVARLLRAGTLYALAEQAAGAQRPDGSWESPYGADWGPYATLGGLAMLVHYPGR